MATTSLAKSYATKTAATAAPVVKKVAAPKPVGLTNAAITPINYLDSDPTYRQDTSNALSDLTSTLATNKQAGESAYTGADANQLAETKAFTDDRGTLGNDFAARGALHSGFYAQNNDKLSADYALQQAQLDQQKQAILQQYGARGAQIDSGAISNAAGTGDSTRLQALLGLLGSSGLNAGTDYRNALSTAGSDSAARTASGLTTITG